MTKGLVAFVELFLIKSDQLKHCFRQWYCFCPPKLLARTQLVAACGRANLHKHGNLQDLKQRLVGAWLKSASFADVSSLAGGETIFFQKDGVSQGSAPASCAQQSPPCAPAEPPPMCAPAEPPPPGCDLDDIPPKSCKCIC